MTIVVTTDEDLRRIIREETRELREALDALKTPTHTNAGEQMLTVDAVAARCSVKPTTVRAWIHAGVLIATRAGRRYLVHVVELDAFLGRANGASSVNSERHLSLLISRLNKSEST